MRDILKCNKKTSSGFATRYDPNWPAQLQKLARGLKFRTYKLEVLYYLSSEQQRCCSDCADACTVWSAPLLFAYGKNKFSHDMAHIQCVGMVRTYLLIANFLDFEQPTFCPNILFCYLICTIDNSPPTCSEIGWLYELLNTELPLVKE